MGEFGSYIYIYISNVTAPNRKNYVGKLEVGDPSGELAWRNVDYHRPLGTSIDVVLVAGTSIEQNIPEEPEPLKYDEQFGRNRFFSSIKLLDN